MLFAAKANGNLAVMRALAKLGAGADVFSGGELALALEAGMPAKKLLFNGSSKTKADLALAVQHGVKVSVDSLDELHQLDAVARDAGKIAAISFRVNPALEVPTHPKIATGLKTSKFGIPHEQIPAAYKEALACKNVKPVGIHCHIGSQILEVGPFAKAAEVMVRIAKELSEMGVKLEFLDLGGRSWHPVPPRYRPGTDTGGLRKCRHAGLPCRDQGGRYHPRTLDRTGPVFSRRLDRAPHPGQLDKDGP